MSADDRSDASERSEPTLPASTSAEPTLAESTLAGEARLAGERFRGHMRRAGQLVAERRLPEAESEIATALIERPGDLRALRLLALVRFRLGRLPAAREAYQQVRAAAPEDATARLNLGLIALRLEEFAEAATELEEAVRLAPEDNRALGYLAHAWARTGRADDAAAAFRRAGQPELADEVEQRALRAARPAAPEPDPELELSVTPPPVDLPAPVTHAEAPAAPEAEPPLDPPPPPLAVSRAASSLDATLTRFALARLVSPDTLSPGGGWATDGVYRLAITAEGVVRADAVLAVTGGLALAPTQRRRRGADGETNDEGPAYHFQGGRGQGEVWLTARDRRGTLSVLTLEDDVLFLREALVVGFSGPLVWEIGAVPLGGPRLIHFTGSGRVVLDWLAEDVIAVRVGPAYPVVVPVARLHGWIGQLVVQSATPKGPGILGGMEGLVACEGEGVLLIARHGQGQAAEPVHQRAEPGHDGAGAADPGGPLLHR